MDTILEDDPLGYDERPEYENYYAYGLASTVVIGLALAFVLFYKAYTENVRIQNEDFQHRDRANLFLDSTYSQAKQLNCEMTHMQERHESEKYEWQAKVKEIQKKYEQAIDDNHQLKFQISSDKKDKTALQNEIKDLQERTRSEKCEFEQQIRSKNEDLEKKKQEIDTIHTNYNKMIDEMSEMAKKARKDIEQCDAEIKRFKEELHKQSLLNRLLKKLGGGGGARAGGDVGSCADGARTGSRVDSEPLPMGLM